MTVEMLVTLETKHNQSWPNILPHRLSALKVNRRQQTVMSTVITSPLIRRWNARAQEMCRLFHGKIIQLHHNSNTKITHGTFTQRISCL